MLHAHQAIQRCQSTPVLLALGHGTYASPEKKKIKDEATELAKTNKKGHHHHTRRKF
jgi:hypothetical protein